MAVTLLQAVVDDKVKPNFLQSISLQDDRDEHHVRGEDVVVIDIDRETIMVVADYNNKCLKIFYRGENTERMTRFSLDGHPCRLARMTNDTIAVNVDGYVQIICLLPEPEIQSVLGSQNMYYALASWGDNELLAAKYSSSWMEGIALHEVSSSGEVLRSISIENKPDQFFSAARMLKMSNDNILVRCQVHGTLTLLSLNGDVKFCYDIPNSSLGENAAGVTTDRAGMIYWAGSSQAAIYELAEEGTDYREVLNKDDGLCLPLGVCIDKERRLYVTDKENIKVYQLPSFAISV